MADNGGDLGCCRCCFSFLLTSGLTALFLWLSLRPSKPTCSIQQIYVPALNKSANSTTNHTIYIDLKLDNKNNDKGIYYDTLNLTLYYGSDRSLPVGNYSIKSFYQGHKKNTHRRNLVDTFGVPWEAVSNGSKAVFRVDLASTVRFKIVGFKTKRRKLMVGNTVEVNAEGKKVKKKGIKLKSGAPKELYGYCAHVRMLVVLVTILLSII